MLATMAWQDGLPPGEHDAVKPYKVLWNLEFLLNAIGCVCFEELDRKPGDFASTVMELLNLDYGITSPQKALREALEGKRVFATAPR